MSSQNNQLRLASRAKLISIYRETGYIHTFVEAKLQREYMINVMHQKLGLSVRRNAVS
jgi:hypothetical protein